MTELVAAALRAGKAAYPRLRIDQDTLAAFLAERAQPDTPVERLAELVLTCACSRGDGAALAELERQFFPELRRLMLRRCRSDSLADEALQILRVRRKLRSLLGAA